MLNYLPQLVDHKELPIEVAADLNAAAITLASFRQEFEQSPKDSLRKKMRRHEKELTDKVEPLLAKYLPHLVTTDHCRTQKSAVAFLIGEGYSLSEATLSNHLRDGFVSQEKSGHIFKSVLIEYAGKYLARGTHTTGEMSDTERILDIKIKSETYRKKEMENRKEDKAWMRTVDHDLAVASVGWCVDGQNTPPV